MFVQGPHEFVLAVNHGTLGPVRLHLAGLGRPIESDRDVAAVLAAFAARSDGLAVRPGADVCDAGGMAIE